jgi:hypothetical protein
MLEKGEPGKWDNTSALRFFGRLSAVMTEWKDSLQNDKGGRKGNTDLSLSYLPLR